MMNTQDDAKNSNDYINEKGHLQERNWNTYLKLAVITIFAVMILGTSLLWVVTNIRDQNSNLRATLMLSKILIGNQVDQLFLENDSITTGYANCISFDPTPIATPIHKYKYFLPMIAQEVTGSIPVATPTPRPVPTEHLYPLRKSTDPNARYLVDANNQPFFINGDTPWSLIGQVSKEDAELYIADSASKGINSLIITLIESHYADNAPANYYGDYPFVDNGNPTNNFTHPNEAYFAHADWVINKANEYGINVILAPMYLGCCDDGYLDELLNDNTEADAEWFGAWVGSRYKNFPNLIYVWGNDLVPGEARSRIFAMVTGAKSQDSNHLHTYHWYVDVSAIDEWMTEWDNTLDMNVTYTYSPVQIEILYDYNRNPAIPFFLFESHYENDWGGANAQQTRRQAYVAVLSGAGGHHYGNNPIWHMNSNDGLTGEWKNHLDDEGREDLLHIRDFFTSRSWFNLIPDQSPFGAPSISEIITSGRGSAVGIDYAPAAITCDHKTIIIYIPERRQITVDLNKINSDSNSAKAWWYDPQTGAATLAGYYSTMSKTIFIPPSSSSEDWLLVIDDADLNLQAPGV